MKESKTLDFIDEKGHENTITLEGEQTHALENKKYKLQTPKEMKKINPRLAKGTFTSDIGIHSSGFAGIMGLALIIAIAGVIIAYLFFKF